MTTLKVQHKAHHPKKRTAREKVLEQMLEKCASRLEDSAAVIKDLADDIWEEDGANELEFIADIRQLIGSTTAPRAELTLVEEALPDEEASRP